MVHQKQFVEYADAINFMDPIDMHRQSRKGASIEVANQLRETAGIQLDFPSWLPAAAKAYHISPNLSDYIMVPVVSIPAGLPNRNGVAFPLAELLAWSVDHGCQAYRTFNGKPVFIEHQNSDPTTAIGVIVDTSLRPMQGFGEGKIWKLVKLLAIDRNKGIEVADDIVRGDLNTYSMGAYVGRYSCSVCESDLGNCSHVDRRRMRDFYVTHNGVLAFRNVHDIVGFETSSVRTPAFLSAASDTIIHF